MSTSPTLRAIPSDASILEAVQPLIQESVRPNSGSVRQISSDPHSQGYIYQDKMEAGPPSKPKELLDLPTDVLHIIIYEVGLFVAKPFSTADKIIVNAYQ